MKQCLTFIMNFCRGIEKEKNIKYILFQRATLKYPYL